MDDYTLYVLGQVLKYYRYPFGNCMYGEHSLLCLAMIKWRTPAAETALSSFASRLSVNRKATLAARFCQTVGTHACTATPPEYSHTESVMHLFDWLSDKVPLSFILA